MTKLASLTRAHHRRAFVIATIIALVILQSIGSALAAPLAGENAWTRSGLGGTQVNTLAVDPENPDIVFAGSQGGGVFRSTDGGQNFQAVNNGLTNLFVNAIAIDPSNPAIVLAGTGRGPAVGEPDAGVYRSTDRGNAWAPVLSGISTHGLARAPQNTRVVYAVGAGIHRSTDGGVTWTQIGTEDDDVLNTDFRAIAVSPNDANVLVAVGNTEGGSGRILRSTDGGSAWSLILDGLPPVLDVAFVPATPGGQAIAIVAGEGGLWRSVDGGASFAQLAGALGGAPATDVLFNPSNPQEAFVGTRGSGVFRSLDSGQTWAAFNTGLANLRVRGLAIDSSLPDPQTIYAGTDDGVFAHTIVALPPVEPAVVWYFAEGSTQAPFDTWFLVQNPTNQPARVRFTFQLQRQPDGSGGGVVTQEVTVGATSRYSLFANQVLPNAAFSTRIEADRAVFAERSMFVGYEGHVVTGIREPNSVWLFAEGSTQDPFHTWLLLQNPHDRQVNATVTYFLTNGAPVTQQITLQPASRTSIFVNSVLPNAAFSTRVNSDQPIVAERAMYRFPGNAATGVSGVAAPSRTWYFADGNTTSGFDTWLLLQNPNSSSVTANVKLFDVDGRQISVTMPLPPTSRQSLFVNQVLPNARFGVAVEANEGIVVEKSLFFGREPRGAAGTQGAAELSPTWNLAEGSTQAPFDEEIAILNPSTNSSEVQIDFQLPNGEVVTRRLTVGPQRSLVIDVNTVLPNTPVSARVTTSEPSVVERTMYFDKLGSRGGHNTIGIR